MREQDSLLFDRNQRSFHINAPLQVSITSNQEFFFRFYCPRGINNVIVWATIEGFDKELRFAEFTRIQPFQEFRIKIPFINKDKIYYTRQGEEVIIPATPDIDANGSDTPYHEMAHCLGYGHSGNMTYYPAEGGFPTICMKVYSQLSREKKLPVYSRRFLHTRRNKNLVENKNIYTASAYIIEDPELDAIDGGLSIPFTETDKAGNEGSPLSFTISVLDVPGATVKTFQPKAVQMYSTLPHTNL